MSKPMKSLLLAAIAVLAITAPAHTAERLRGNVSLDGSSTVFPISEAVAEEFLAVQPRVRVTVGVSGTGGGFKKFLALHQPVAADLRFIVVALKVNNDLERIGDFSVKISRQTLAAARKQLFPFPPNVTDRMSGIIRVMVRNSLDAFVKLDVDLATEVIQMDDQVDAINRKIKIDLPRLITENPADIEGLLDLHSTSRFLERIGDLATNIAEDVIFMVRGEVVRHQAPTSSWRMSP